MIDIKTKLNLLAKQNHKREGILPVIRKGTPEWDMWISWRKRHKLGTVFMQSHGFATVPCDLPPTNLDEALKPTRNLAT